MSRSVDLILRLFCLGQLFTCLRPYLLVGFARSLEEGGIFALASAVAEAWPFARWFVYAACLAIVVLGARPRLVYGLAASQLLDVGTGIWSNSLASGYSEKGLLVLVSVGVAGLFAVDRGEESERAARHRDFLRLASGLGFGAIALNKMNSDFLVSATSCARALNEGLAKMVPLFEPLARPLSDHAWGALLMETLLLPLLLAFPRIGVLYAWGFFVNVAMVGPRATTFVFMALALSFLPTSDWSRLQLRSPAMAYGATLSVLGSTLFWMLTLDPGRRFALSQLAARVSFLSVGLLGLGLFAANAAFAFRSGESGPPEARSTIASRFRSSPPWTRALVAAVLGLLLLNELSPYLGLKTKYSLTMWSNLRTDSGRWNSLVFPELLRVSGRADRALLVVSEIRTRAAVDWEEEGDRSRATESTRLLPPFVAAHGTARAHLSRLESKHGVLRFQVRHDGTHLAFQGAGPGSRFDRFINASRPRVDWFEDAVMSLRAPQRCLGP